MSVVPKISRERIVEIASELFYHNGYNQTSFSQLAEACHIPKGNFYYHFKTKQDILDAVIDKRTNDIVSVLQSWDDESSDPHARLLCFVRMLKRSQDELLRFGCPMGTINLELGKSQPQLQTQSAKMFELFINWLVLQFNLLGYEEEKSRFKAYYLMNQAQGCATLLYSLKDKSMFDKQLAYLEDWLNTIKKS